MFDKKELAMSDELLHQLRALLSDRAEIKDEIARQQAELAQIETAIAMLVAPLDGPVKVPGIGSVTMTRPSVTRRFSPDRLRELIQSLRESGNEPMAQEIEACQVEGELAGRLQISPERKRAS